MLKVSYQKMYLSFHSPKERCSEDCVLVSIVLIELARPLSSKADGACLAGGDLHVEQLKVLALKVPSRTPPQGVNPSKGLTAQV